MPYITRIDYSTRKGLFKTSYISVIVMGIIFPFISWFIGLIGDNTKYSDYKKNQLHLLGQRLGVGVAIGTFWGPMIAIAMLANFIRSMKALYIIAFLLILSASVLLAFACIKKFHSTYKTIVERNDEYNSFIAETNKFVEKFSQEIDNNIECDKDNDKIKVTNKTNSEQEIKKQIKTKTEKHIITAKKNKRKE